MSDTIIQKTISDFPLISTVNDNIRFVIDDGVTTKSVKQSQFIVTGAGIPTSAPTFIGQRYIDTTNGWRYTATGISAVSDWHLEYAYGTTTVTAGGGDVTINFGGNWVNGNLIVLRSTTALSDYFSAPADILRFDTTFDSLTNVIYTTAHVLDHRFTAFYHATQTKTNVLAGLPNAATTTTISFDDDGATTVYIKWIVFA
jgi:hypothetical protein